MVPSRIFAGPALAQPADAESADDGAVVVALGTGEDDELARLRAGEATGLVLLTATAQGSASCPVTEPLQIADTRAAVQGDVFGTSGFPQMLLRIGWAPVNAEPVPATPRRPLADVVEWLDWAAWHREGECKATIRRGRCRRRRMVATMTWTDGRLG